jgi:uncharacterized surface protein with fasciclin (FAS1) repeats
MLRRFLPLLAVAGLVAGLLSVSSIASAQSGTSKNIVEVAQSDPQFSTLVQLVTSADLAETLSSGKYTVVAPTTAAVAKVPKATLDGLAQDPAKLKAVLLYHVVKGRVPASKVVTLSRVKTVEGSNVRILVRGGKVYLNGSTRVTKTNVRASNGYIHVIDKVLIPPS